MRKILSVAVLVAACGPAFPRTHEATDCTGDPNEVCGQQPDPTPPLVRHESVVPDKMIDGIAISAVPYGAAGWTLTIANNTDNSASAVWDESSFVVSSGETAGRLIPGETRRIDVSNVHPPTPIAPHSKLVENVVVEKLLPVEEFETRVAQTPPGQLDLQRLATIRANNAKLRIGGKIYVVLSTGSGKATWSGTVRGGHDARASSIAP